MSKSNHQLHTKKDAEYCLWYFKKYVCGNAQLIGAFGKGLTESRKDIDIYLPNIQNIKWTDMTVGGRMRAEKLRNKIARLIDAQDYERTDWGGWFFHNTVFGNVDVFFDISAFDY